MVKESERTKKVAPSEKIVPCVVASKIEKGAWFSDLIIFSNLYKLYV